MLHLSKKKVPHNILSRFNKHYNDNFSYIDLISWAHGALQCKKEEKWNNLHITSMEKNNKNLFNSEELPKESDLKTSKGMLKTIR